jgi:hypothetical protein
MEGLIEGRIVHYVPGPNDGFSNPDAHRPAIVVHVWDRTSKIPCVQLQVFTDGSNDGPGKATGLYWATSVAYSEKPEPRTWHWIERA